MNQYQSTCAASMRVGVGIVGFAVGSPAGMAHANMAADVFVFGKFHQVGDFALFFVNIEVAVLQGNTGTVVSAVFQALQAL